jgi:hypothetical protein
VIYDQRPAEEAGGSAAGTGNAWQPAESDVAGTRSGLAGARYVAVDRIDDALVTLAVAPWPTVDPATGRLDFGPPDERRTLVVPSLGLQRRIDDQRSQARQLLRPVRPGDAFFVGGYEDDPEGWTDVIDVTRSARLAAKAALFSTAAPAPAADALEDYGLEDARIEDGGAATRGTASGARGEPSGPEPGDEPGEPEDDAPPPGPIAYPAV